VFEDSIDRTGTTSRTYTATIVLHDATTSGAGYALLDARLDVVPPECRGGCVVSNGGVTVTSGDSSVRGDVTAVVTALIEVPSWTGMTELPVGRYVISVGAVAGVAEQDVGFTIPMPCMTDGCYFSPTVHAGIGSADISATVQKVTR
jgi:hypothetical protein